MKQPQVEHTPKASLRDPPDKEFLANLPPGGESLSMRLIDTHCHLAHGRLRQDADAVLSRAAAAGVVACICAAGDLHESVESLMLAKKYPQVFCTAGVHPHEAKNAGEGCLDRLKILASEPKNVAIGEIGLDYHYNFSPPEAQRRVFSEQLELAGRLGKIAVIHTREAFDDTMAILRESGVEGSRVVFHSFTEGPSQARAAVEFGSAVGFSGIITFRNAGELRQSAARVPPERLLVETDAPYLSPEPVRKMKTNEPANVAHVAAFLASERGMRLEELAELTTANALRIFGISL